VGKPGGACVNCRLRPPGTVESLRQKVAAFIDETAPPPEFEPEAYLAANPDVARAAIDPARHFSNFGRIEGRRLFPDSALPIGVEKAIRAAAESKPEEGAPV
ncbi:hypothetical protein, partial [Mycobacterium sp.]|uniref:hypothetical protein n=1 Tax=Mycobacterium sp. TaxID=1785 RepID=UPI003F9EB740